MAMDVWTLIERDHRELDLTLTELMDPTGDPTPALDAARLGFAAHAEAHSLAVREALAPASLPKHLAALFRELSAAHDSQERQLTRMASAPVAEWPRHASALRDALRNHHSFERVWCLPILRTREAAATPAGMLAATYATERLRALAWAWQVEPLESMKAAR
jgi:hypothetical protein